MKKDNSFFYRISKLLLLSFLLFVMAGISSCSSSPSKKLNGLVGKAIRSSNDVNEAEWKEMTTYILSEKKSLKEYITPGGQADTAKLRQLILQTASRRRGSPALPEIFTPVLSDPAKRPHFNLYIENSMSMDGYVKGNTQFEAAITKLMVLMKNYSGQDKLHINFINSKIIPAVEVDISNFANKLEPKSVTYNVGGAARGVSDLNRVFKMVLDSTRSEISVLISDCIYSLGRGQDTDGSLNIQKSLTMDAFLEKLQYNSDLATICLKMVSDFNGLYYDKDNTPTAIDISNRPYYIWLMGPRTALEEFYKSVAAETDLQGYRNSFILFPSIAGRQPYYTVLKETNKKGSFKSDRGNREYVHAIDDIGYDDGVLQFSVAVDMRNIPVDTSYLLDKKNYKPAEGFVLNSIQALNREVVTRRDWVTVENSTATHLLTFQISRDINLRDLNIQLMRQVPGWVAGTHCTNDKDVRAVAEKTFGLLHLVEGVSDAYKRHQPNDQSFFNITVTIKR